MPAPRRLRWSTPLLALLLLAVVAAPAGAQDTHELRGQVVDSVSGVPLAGAIVRIPAVERYTITNESGWFRFTGLEARLYVLTVGQLGYGEVTPAVRVPRDAPLIVHVPPRPFELEAVRAHNDRLYKAAKARAHPYLLIGAGFFRVFDRDRILETGAVHGLEFLALGPHMPVMRCDLNDPEEQMCTRMPMLHGSDLGRMGGVYQASAGLPSRPPVRGIRGIKWVAQPHVFLDDEFFPGGIAGLASVPMGDIHRVETFGIRGERQIRFYTAGYLHLLATGVQRPVFSLTRAQVYEPPWLVTRADTIGR